MLNSIPKAGEIVEISLKKALRSLGKGKGGKRGLKSLKERESKKIFLFSKELGKRLLGSVNSFPRFEEMEPFPRELADLLVDEEKTRRALAQLNASRKLVREKGNLFAKEIWKQRNAQGVKKKSREALGRIASIVKKNSKNISELNNAAKALREIPSVGLEKSVILAGFPNTGKTTTLKRLTGSNPKIAPYPFTTKNINIGYMQCGHKRVQVIDTPGLLDRRINERNPIEKKAVLALKHLAGIIVFVLDASGQCGYSIEEQFALLEGLVKSFPGIPVITALNKADLCSDEELEKAERKSGKLGFEAVEQGEGLSAECLKEAAFLALGQGHNSL